MKAGVEALPDDVEALKAALIVARAEAAAARARQSDDQALIAHLKLQIEKLNRDRYGPRSERTARLLDQFAESYGGPRLVSVTARRYGLSASQLFTWRRLAREDRLSGDAVPALVPVEIAFTPAPASTCTPKPPSSPPAQCARVGIIEIELSGWQRPPRMDYSVLF